MVGTGGIALSALAPLAKTATKSSGSSYTGFIFILLLIAVFYFLVIRPQRQRQKAMLETRRNLEPGVEVLTTFGLYASVVEVEDDAIVLEVAPGVRSRYSPQVVARVISPETVEDPAEAVPTPTEVPAQGSSEA